MPYQKLFANLISIGFLTILFSFQSANGQSVKLVSDMVHSNIGFSVPLAGGLSRVTGKFNHWEIIVNYVDSEMTKSTIIANIKAASINTGEPGRDEHLASPDFFDAGKYPDITFTSDSITKKGESYAAFGTFQCHGVTKKIFLVFSLSGKDAEGSVGFTARYNLKRSDYLLGKDAESDKYISNNITIEIDFVAKKPKEKPKE